MKHETLNRNAPYVREIVYWEPSRLAERLRGEKHLTLLESVLRQEHLGRYSFLACNPTLTLTAQGNTAFIDGAIQNETPLKLLDRLRAQHRRTHVQGLPPFQGGFAGFIAYEFGRSLEPQARIPQFTPLCPDMMLHLYETVIAFDHMQEAPGSSQRDRRGPIIWKAFLNASPR